MFSCFSPPEAIRALCDLAERVGVEVRIEPFGLRQLHGKGGLCRVRGTLVILVDAALAPVEQAGVLGEALGGIDLGTVIVPAGLAPYLKSGHAQVRPLVRPRPLARGRRTREH